MALNLSSSTTDLSPGGSARCASINSISPPNAPANFGSTSTACGGAPTSNCRWRKVGKPRATSRRSIHDDRQISGCFVPEDPPDGMSEAEKDAWADNKLKSLTDRIVEEIETA